MRKNKIKSQKNVEYKSTFWGTEITGDGNDSFVKTIIVVNFILKWGVRILWVLTAWGIRQIIP